MKPDQWPYIIIGSACLISGIMQPIIWQRSMLIGLGALIMLFVKVSGDEQ